MSESTRKQTLLEEYNKKVIYRYGEYEDNLFSKLITITLRGLIYNGGGQQGYLDYLTEENIEKLNYIFDLSAVPNTIMIVFAIDAYSSKDGGDKGNETLSQKRAEAIKYFLYPL